MLDLEPGEQFLQQYGDRRVVLAPHPDADGLASAALLWRFLTGERLVLCPEKGESIHTEKFRARLQDARPDAVIVIDQGSREGAVLPGTPTLTIDHHFPSGQPEGVYLTSYPYQPTESASLMCYRLVGEPPELLWLSAIGLIGDYTVLAPFAQVREAIERYSKTMLQEVVSLINAGRRSSRFDWAPAFNALITATDPRQIADAELPEVAQLHADREEVKREAQRARKSHPYFADPWAVLPFASAALVHGLVASSWTGRLKEHYVVAANFGYRPGFVHFAVRTERDVNLIAELRALAPGGLYGEWGHGHRKATGGSLARADFLLLLNRMGFTPQQVLDIEHAAISRRAA